MHELQIHRDFPAEFHVDASITIGEDGMPVVSGRRVDAREFLSASFEAIDFALRDRAYIHHYFHYVELHLLMMAIVHRYWPHRPCFPQRIFVGDQNWSPASQNHAQAELVARTMPRTRVVSGRGGLSRACIVIDRDLGLHADLNKFTTFAEDALTTAADAMRSLMRASVAGEEAVRGPRRAPLALYVGRPPPRYLPDDLLAGLEDACRSAGLEWGVVDFAALTFAEQVGASSTADILIGVHGNGLTHCLWMNPGSTLIEIFPPGCHHYDYQLLAEGASLRYVGLEGRGRGGFVYTDGSRFGPAYGSPNESRIADLPWARLHLILPAIRGRLASDRGGERG